MTPWEEEEWIRSQKGTESGEYNFAIEDIKTEKYIGGCGIHKVNWLTRVATVGMMIGDKDYWGKGYGTDAMKVLMKFIFEDMNMNKIRLSVFSFNERAKRCYEKCGFQVEGILKKEIFKEGKYYDEIIMSAFNK
jgi:RimJ/RimL family protein N-acetyltransferase